MSNVQVQSEKRKLEQEVIGLNERSRQQDEDNERLKSEISFLRWVVMVVEMVVGGEAINFGRSFSFIVVFYPTASPFSYFE